MLGGKGLEPFIYSAEHDDDEEFLRRFAGTPTRIHFMLTWHADEARAKPAIQRLASLTNTKQPNT